MDATLRGALTTALAALGLGVLLGLAIRRRFGSFLERATPPPPIVHGLAVRRGHAR
jgi:hypothetical protein